MTREAHELKIREWVVLGTGLADTQVVFAGQVALPPRPAKPYATVLIISEALSDANVETTDVVLGSGFEQHHDAYGTGTVSVQIFGDTHRKLMGDLVLSLRTGPVAELFQTGGVVTVAVTSAGSGGFSEDQPLLSTSFEPRTQRDFLFTFSRSLVVEVEPIDTIAAPGTIT